VPAESGVVARIDLAQMRASANASDYAELLRLSHTHAHLFADLGIDPIEDFDRVVIAAPTLVHQRTLVVVRHRRPLGDIVSRVERESAARSWPLEWSRSEGFRHVRWPCRSWIPRQVVVTGPRELVIAPDEVLADVVVAARDHLARAPDGSPIEPSLASAVPGELARIWATQGLPLVAGQAPLSADFVMREAGGGRTECILDLAWADENASAAAAAELRSLAEVYLREPMLGGVARILSHVRVVQRGAHTTAYVLLDDAELGSGLETAAVVARFVGWSS
jgi:hypothetical protein